MKAFAWLDRRRGDAAGALALLALALGLPFVIEDRFYLNLLFLVMLYGGLASAWNLLGGFAGQFSLGHTAFFGIGAYTSTLLYTMAGVSPWIGALAGVALSALLAFLISYPTFRLRGVFFSMATIAVGETARIVLLWLRRYAEIPYGISINYEPGLARMMFAEPRSYALLGGLFMLLVCAVAYVLSRSRPGYYLNALRDNEEAARASGIDLRRYKLLALLLSAGFTSLGGTLMAQYVLYIEPGTVFSLAISVDLALMSILGGLGTLAGPLLGAAVAVPLQEFLRDWLGSAGAGAHLAVYGALLVVIVMLMPQGVVGAWSQRRRKQANRTREAARHA
ncbi:branched-chain amino acid ABC transporter permease [Bordetella hinzii]|uniref:Branched-chain amino acid ABC transporter permease n=3 Tax=Bordetella hinzii TaxID=103855 RepID=A0AAN1RUU3_9BORD|nr:branched-chain amino acid ABC transporter permease [Bordetella hinzii]AKQ54204.1 leucine/isoleucine/valine transporter permease subunit [Bordetella hinzii]AKQ58718.1 leucine/isoleucine/valine transporter permease subunit [Bordetella hinzii]AZW15998.1 branched-chain amino acid ABC transporter permease [Bordetella hinzii]KCB26196.1 branched-chain amino acid ABC transporter, permease protein [Bordetella hinzii OH87 BAL007II]KCB28933.1 branched-chain amino acid ABC transporter, permease protein